MPTILLADDDVELTALLADYLRIEGFGIVIAHDGAAAARAALDPVCDLVVLDVMMPARSGLDALREIRAASNVPVLMLTARGDEVDKVVGLELGADDYVAKPCTPRELVARIRAILRRTARESAPVAPEADREPGQDLGAEAGGEIGRDIGRAMPERLGADRIEPLVAGALRLWPRSRRVQWHGRELPLTSTQFSVLEVLLRDAGSIVSKQALSRRALSRPLGRFDRSLDVHVSILRQKLDGPDGGDRLIKTVRGVGYQLAVG